MTSRRKNAECEPHPYGLIASISIHLIGDGL